MAKRRGGGRRRTESRAQTRKPSIFDAVSRLAASNWGPPVFFALLSIVYFAGFVFTDDVIYGSDLGTDFHRGDKPFMVKVGELGLPAWLPFNGGMPGTSASRHDYFMPVHLLKLFTSDYRYYGWRYIVAMFCAGYFAFLCLRGYGVRPLAAWLGGVAFASAPTVLGFTQAGHYAKMSAIAVFPLSVWGLHRGMQTRRRVYFLIASLGIALGVYSPHIQIVYYSLWGLGTVFAFELIAHYLRERSTGAVLNRSLLAAGAVCLGLAIGAEGVFPPWEAGTLSKRGVDRGEEAGMAFSASWSLHPEDLVSLLVPEFGHFNQLYWGHNAGKWNSDYVGIVVLFLAALSLGRVRKDFRVKLFLSLFLLVIVFSLGTHTPVYRLFYYLVPGVRDLRAVGMIAFLFAFPACALAALGLDRVLSMDADLPDFRRRVAYGIGVALFALVGLALLPGTAVNVWNRIFWPDMPPDKAQIAVANLPHLARGAWIAILIVIALFALTWRRIQGRISAPAFAILLLPIMLFDTWRIDREFLTYVDPSRYLPGDRVNAVAVEFLQQDSTLYRVLPLPNGDQVQLPGVTLVSQFHDFTLPRYDRLLKSGMIGHPGILNLVNTRYVVSTNPVPEEWFGKPSLVGGLHIYRNPDALPWFYLASDFLLEKNEDRVLQLLGEKTSRPSRQVILEEAPPAFIGPEPDAYPGKIERLVYDLPNGIIDLQVDAPGPRLLVISENHHPYWHAYVDGEEVPILRANYLWQAVALKAGEHRVELRCRDRFTEIYRLVSIAGALVLLAGLVICLRRRETDARETTDG